MIHYKKRTWVILLGMFVAIFTFTFLTGRIKDNQEAAAANPWAFDAGYIISDWQMSNYTSMSEADIQNFLNSKNGCNNRDYGFYQNLEATYPNLDWHWDGSRIVCLAQERFNGNSIGSGQTAAHIIWQVAQDYRINPQVLIVLLEKEQGLITDTYPNNKQYQTATGFGCPDTAPCDSQYFGLENQLRKAAGLFREVLDGGWTNYPVGNNYVLYNPNTACGGTIVNIRNRATSALYRYTPYQPNHSALAAGYGVGDACGAYGNRNFYLMFEDWFGGITREKDPYKEAITSYERPVEDGTYRLVSKAFPNKTADIHGGAVKNGKMQVYDKKPTANDKNVDNQLFEIKYDSSNGYYTIKNAVSGSSFDVRNVETNNRTQIDVYPENGGCNQDWLFKRDTAGYYTIISRCSSRVVDIKEGSNDLIIYDDHNGDNQKWKLEKVTNGDEIISGTYRFISKMYPDQSIDIEGGLKSNASLISYKTKNSDFDNQKFEIRYNESDGYYNIVNPANGSAFDVRNGKINKNNLTPVDVYPLHSECNQDWSIEKTNDGYYKFRSACSNRVLDIVDSTRKLIIYDDHNGDNQKWKLEKLN